MYSDKWIEIFSALLTPTVAILGLYIAWQQWKTNETKRKQELFDKRWEFYTRIKKRIDDHELGNDFIDPTDFFLFNDTYDKAKFLFGSDIAEHILNFDNKGYDFTGPFEKYLKIESTIPDQTIWGMLASTIFSLYKFLIPLFVQKGIRVLIRYINNLLYNVKQSVTSLILKKKPEELENEL